jgi:hypothetical protein
MSSMYIYCHIYSIIIHTASALPCPVRGSIIIVKTRYRLVLHMYAIHYMVSYSKSQQVASADDYELADNLFTNSM